MARLDLCLVAAQRGQPNAAAELGMAALRSGRVVGSTLGWFAELDTMLQNSHPDLAEVEDFHEQYIYAIRSV